MFRLASISHYGDVLAIPFFLLSLIYFYRLEDKDMTERALLMFSLAGFILDLAFTYQHFFA